MSYGIQVTNNLGTFTVDESYINARLVRQDFGFKNAAPWVHNPVLSYDWVARGLNMAYPSLILARPTNPAKYFGAAIVGGSELSRFIGGNGVDIYSQDATAIDIAIFSEEVAGIESTDTFGLEVWNSGKKAFTTKSQYPRITHLFWFSQPYSCGTRTFNFSGYTSTPWVLMNTLYGASGRGECDEGSEGCYNGCLVKFPTNNSMTVTHGGYDGIYTTCSGNPNLRAAGPEGGWYIAICKINEGA